MNFILRTNEILVRPVYVSVTSIVMVIWPSKLDAKQKNFHRQFNALYKSDQSKNRFDEKNFTDENRFSGTLSPTKAQEHFSYSYSDSA